MKITPDGTFHVGRVFGHELKVSFTFVLLMLIFSQGLPMPNALAASVAIALSIVVHELGHAAAFKRFGCGTSEIMLHGFGGLTRNWHSSRLSRRESMWVSAWGPLAGLLLSVPFLAWTLLRGEGRTLLDWFAMIMSWINVFWSLFNLLPIYPLDGGQIFLRFAGRWTTRSAALTGKVSLACLGLVAVWAIQDGQPFTIIMLLMLGWQSWQLLGSTR